MELIVFGNVQDFFFTWINFREIMCWRVKRLLIKLENSFSWKLILTNQLIIFCGNLISWIWINWCSWRCTYLVNRADQNRFWSQHIIFFNSATLFLRNRMKSAFLNYFLSFSGMNNPSLSASEKHQLMKNAANKHQVKPLFLVFIDFEARK